MSACATGGHAIGEAWETIRRGDADIMLAGGAEAGIYEALVGGFAAMRALSTRNDDPAAASRPFDTGRDGFVSARARASWSSRTLEHAAGPRRDAAGRARRLRRDRRRVAHHAAGARAGSVPSARRGGPSRRPASTPDGRRPRQRPRDVDARRATRPSSRRSGRSSATTPARSPITANKSMLGHTLGAAGAIEAIATILAIREGCVPPTINLTDPDPEPARAST